MARLIADAGLLIAAERGERGAWALKRTTAEDGVDLVVPAPVLSQVWRGPRPQNLTRFLAGLEVITFDEELARRAGELLGASATTDVCDASVVAGARDGDRVVTGDVEDITHLVAHSGSDISIRAL